MRPLIRLPVPAGWSHSLSALSSVLWGGRGERLRVLEREREREVPCNPSLGSPSNLPHLQGPAQSCDRTLRVSVCACGRRWRCHLHGHAPCLLVSQLVNGNLFAARINVKTLLHSICKRASNPHKLLILSIGSGEIMVDQLKAGGHQTVRRQTELKRFSNA